MNDNKTIPSWALRLSKHNYATGGITPKIYGENATFLDVVGNEQVGMVQDMDDKGAELFYEERFLFVPSHRIIKFN